MILLSILILGTRLDPIVGTLLAIPATVAVVTLVERLTTRERDKKAASDRDRHGKR